MGGPGYFEEFLASWMGLTVVKWAAPLGMPVTFTLKACKPRKRSIRSDPRLNPGFGAPNRHKKHI